MVLLPCPGIDLRHEFVVEARAARCRMEDRTQGSQDGEPSNPPVHAGGFFLLNAIT